MMKINLKNVEFERCPTVCSVLNVDLKSTTSLWVFQMKMSFILPNDFKSKRLV